MKTIEDLFQEYLFKMKIDYNNISEDMQLEIKKAFYGGIHQSIKTLLNTKESDDSNAAVKRLLSLVNEEQEFWTNLEEKKCYYGRKIS